MRFDERATTPSDTEMEDMRLTTALKGIAAGSASSSEYNIAELDLHGSCSTGPYSTSQYRIVNPC